MTLTVQLQSIAFSFFFGFFFSGFYSFINRLFYRYRKRLIRYFLQVIVGFLVGLLYFLGMVKINDGIIRFYYFIALLIGYLFYEINYAMYCLILLERFMKLLKKILLPLLLVFRKIHGIIKIIRKRVKKWHKKHEDLNSED